jgi:hypothetical protein
MVVEGGNPGTESGLQAIRAFGQGWGRGMQEATTREIWGRWLRRGYLSKKETQDARI